MDDLEPEPTAAPPARGGALPRRVKALYGLGDHTINLSLSPLAFLFGYFLTEVTGVRPALAGPGWADPADRPRRGRRERPPHGADLGRHPMKGGPASPFVLIGMVPFGAAFASLWWNVPTEDPLARFAYHAGAYVLYSLGG